MRWEYRKDWYDRTTCCGDSTLRINPYFPGESGGVYPRCDSGAAPDAILDGSASRIDTLIERHGGGGGGGHGGGGMGGGGRGGMGGGRGMASGGYGGVSGHHGGHNRGKNYYAYGDNSWGGAGWGGYSPYYDDYGYGDYTTNIIIAPTQNPY